MYQRPRQTCPCLHVAYNVTGAIEADQELAPAIQPISHTARRVVCGKIGITWCHFTAANLQWLPVTFRNILSSQCEPPGPV